MKLLVIEGLDGSGKSTQIKLLTEYLTGKDYHCEYLHFPRTDAPYFGELIARFLRGEFGTLETVDPYLVAMLYAGDRKDASCIIRKWLNDGKVVILDRYTYSNIAYQCAKMNDTVKKKDLMSWIFSLEFDHFEIPRPDINIFLDVPFTFTEKKLKSPRSGDDRTYLNGTADIHESSLDFQKKVRDIYLEVAGWDNRLAVIDCTDKNKGSILPQGDIFRMIIGLLEKRKLTHTK
jgi:dTMP kinase